MMFDTEVCESNTLFAITTDPGSPNNIRQIFLKKSVMSSGGGLILMCAANTVTPYLKTHGSVSQVANWDSTCALQPLPQTTA